MRGVVLALLLIAAPAVATPRAQPEVAAKAAQAEAAALKAENAGLRERAEVEKRLATLEGKTAAEDRARDNLTKEMTFLGNVITLFGSLITAIVFGAGIASYFAAGSRAEKKAKEELAEIREGFDRNVEKKLAEIDARVAAVNTIAADVERRAAETANNVITTNEHVAEIASQRAKMDALTAEAHEKMPLIREAARISEELGRSNSTGSDRKEASDEQKQKIIAAVAESAGQPEAEWSIDQYKAAIGKALYADRDWTLGAELAQRLIERHRADREALRFGLQNLGWTEINRRRWQQALNAYTALAEDYEAGGETERPAYCFARHQQGYILNELRRCAAAEALYRELLPLCERVIGAEASGTVATRHNLARAVLDQGRAAEAEAMLRALLPLRERVDGAEASSTLDTRHGLARAILNQGRAAEAEAMLRALLPLRERVNGAEASGTLATRHGLAVAILDQGRAAEAEAMLRALLSLRERVIGDEASGTLITRHELARAILDQGRAAEAEAMLRALLPLRERVNGAEALGTLATRHGLAVAILDQGRAAEAERLFRALLPLRERVDGAANSGTYVTRYCWADALVRSGRPAEAREALASIPDPVPNEDWPPRHEAALAFVRGRVADALGERAAADGHLARAQKIFAEIYPADHIRRRELEEYIANRPGPSA